MVGLPVAQGLYDPRNEHDACGIGFVVNTKGEQSPDMGAHGPHFTGIHHFGFEVDDLDGACAQLENAHGERLTAKDHVDATMAAGGHANFEMKWSGPDGVVIDISHTGWEGTD